MQPRNPYVGPRTFRRDEGHLFFGREREARDLIALVSTERLVVLYAQSGAGKSSIVNTRLIPALTNQGYEVLLPVGRVSGDTAAGIDVDNIYVYNLIRSIEQHHTDPASLAQLSLSHFLAHLNFDGEFFFYDPSPVEVISEEDLSELGRRALIIDQFEELFSTHPESWEKREDFFNQLAKAMQDDPLLWVVLVMREDYIAALDPYAHLVRGGLQTRYYMQRLEREAALQAVKSPVQELRPYAPGVAEKLIDDLCSITVQAPDGSLDVQPGQYVEPVQLQVVCYGLWENLPIGGTEITEKDLADVGDVDQALGKYYDRRVSEVAIAKNVRERLIREWFEKKLITAGGIRNMVLQELDKKSGELDDEVIQALQSDLVRAEKRGGATWYELTHDRLVDPILERNRIWFNENLSALQRQAALWKDQDQNESWLLRDQALVDVQAWATEHQDELTQTEKEFLAACQNAQAQIEKQQADERNHLEMAQKFAEEQARSAELAKRSAQAARRFSVFALSLVAVAIVFALLAFNAQETAQEARGTAEASAARALTAEAKAVTAQVDAQNKAKRARAGDLISLASDNDSQYPDVAALLRLQAYDENPNTRTLKFMLSTLQDFAGRNSYLDQLVADPSNCGASPSCTFQFSPDGKTLAALDGNGGITFWDLNPPEKLNSTPISLQHFNPVYPIALSRDGSILASASQDGTVVLWEAVSGKQLTNPLQEHTLWIDGMNFSPTKDILATSSDDKTIILWDVSMPENTRKISVLAGHTAWVGNAVFSSDGNTLVSTEYQKTILWDIRVPENPQEIATIPSGSPHLNSVAFGKDDKILASVTDNGSIILWNISYRKKPIELTVPPHIVSPDGDYFTSLAFHPNGKTLIVIGRSSITFWNVEDPTNPTQIGDSLTKYAGTSLFNLNTLALDPDGKLLAVGGCASEGCDRSKIFMWDISRLDLPKELGVPPGVRSTVVSLAFNLAGDMLASGDLGGSVLRWDLTNKRAPIPLGSPLRAHSGQTATLSFSQDGNLLFANGPYRGSILINAATQTVIGTGDIPYTDPDKKILLYHYLDGQTGDEFNQILEVATGKSIGGPIPGMFLAISPSKNLVLYQTIGKKGESTINLWDVAKDHPVKTDISGTYLAFSADSQILAYQESDKEEIPLIRLIDTAAGNSLSPPLRGTFQAFSPNGKLMVYTTETDDGSYFDVWNIARRKPDFHILGTYAAISQDATVLIHTTADGNVNILNTATGSTTSQPGSIIAVSPDNKVLIYQVADDKTRANTINVLDLTTGHSTVPYPHPLLGNSAFFSSDNKILIVETYDSSTTQFHLNFINLDTGVVSDPFSPCRVSGFGPFIYDGANLETLACLVQPNNNIGLIDVKTGKPLGTPVQGSYLGMSSDHKTLAYQVSVKNTLGLLDMTSGIGMDTHIAGTFLGFSPDDQKLIYRTMNPSAVGFLDAATGQPLGKVTIQGTYLGYSPAGNLIASRDRNGKVNLWNMPQAWTLGDRLKAQPAAPIQTAVLSRDGKILASTNEEGIFLQNPIRDSAPQKWDNNHLGGVASVVFPQSGSSFLTIGDDKRLILWEWDAKSGPERLSTEPIPGTSGLLSPDGKTLIAADRDKNITSFISVDNFAVINRIAGLPICRLKPEENMLVVNDSTTGIHTRWDLTTLEQIGAPISGTDAHFGSTCRFLAIGDQASKSTRLFDLTTAQPASWTVEGSYRSFSLNDGILLTTDDTNKLLAWKLTDRGPKPFTRFNSTEMTGGNPILSPNGKFLFLQSYFANGSYESALWNFGGDYLAKKIQASPTQVEFSSDERFLAMDQVQTTSLWDLAGSIVGPKEISGNRFQFSPQAHYLAARDENTLYIWDLTRDDSLFETPIDKDTEITFSRDDAYLAVSNKDKKNTALFDLSGAAPQTPIQTIPGTSPRFNATSKFLVTSNAVLNLTTPRKLATEDHSETYDLADSPDGNSLAIYGSNGVTLRNVEGQTQPHGSLQGHTGFIKKLILSPQGKIMATIASDGIMLTDITDPSHEKQVSQPIPGASIDFSSDGQIVAIGDDINKQTALWDISDLSNIKQVFQVKGVRGMFGPNDGYLITTDLENNNTWVWDLAKQNFDTPEKVIPGTFTTFSRDRQLMAVFNHKGITGQSGPARIGSSSIWDMVNLTKIEGTDFTLTSPCPTSDDQNKPIYPQCMFAAFTPDGKILAHTDGQNIFLRDTQKPVLFGKIEAAYNVNHLSFVFEGVFDTADQTTDGIKSSVLVIGSSDGTFTLWEIPSRIQLSNPIPGTFVGAIPNLKVNRLIYVGKDTKELIAWDMNPVDWSKKICTIASRNLTEREWKSFIPGIPYPTDPKLATCPGWPLISILSEAP